MKPVIFLRIASGLTFLHGVMHTIGGVFGRPEAGAGETAFAAMKANTFPVMGLTRSYARFYTGFGLGITISLLMEAVVFWQLSVLAKTESARLRPVYATFLVGYLLFAVNSWMNFFPPPVIGEVLIAVCLGMAFVASKPAAAGVSGARGSLEDRFGA